MTYSFGTTSRNRLHGVHPKLVDVCNLAITLTRQDFMVIEGVRTEQRQLQLYRQGRTTPGPIVTWTMSSKHFVNKKTGFGHAVDLVPYPVDWQTLSKFDEIARAMYEAADILETPIRWGADWNRNGKPRERRESDSPHFELWGV